MVFPIIAGAIGAIASKVAPRLAPVITSGVAKIAPKVASAVTKAVTPSLTRAGQFVGAVAGYNLATGKSVTASIPTPKDILSVGLGGYVPYTAGKIVEAVSSAKKEKEVATGVKDIFMREYEKAKGVTPNMSVNPSITPPSNSVKDKDEGLLSGAGEVALGAGGLIGGAVLGGIIADEVRKAISGQVTTQPVTPIPVNPVAPAPIISEPAPVKTSAPKKKKKKAKKKAPKKKKKKKTTKYKKKKRHK